MIAMNQRNYQRELNQTIERLLKEGQVPRLLLHSSYVLEYLSEYFSITVFYYNPNIFPAEEYEKRVKEQEAFISRLPVKNRISFLEGPYEQERFYETAKGLEGEPEVER